MSMLPEVTILLLLAGFDIAHCSVLWRVPLVYVKGTATIIYQFIGFIGMDCLT